MGVEQRKRRVWQRRTYIWVLGGLALVSALIYWEQTALLFGLSTLAMCVLLAIVAIADLEGRDKTQHQQAQAESKQTTTSAASLKSAEPRKQRGAA